MTQFLFVIRAIIGGTLDDRADRFIILGGILISAGIAMRDVSAGVIAFGVFLLILGFMTSLRGGIRP